MNRARPGTRLGTRGHGNLLRELLRQRPLARRDLVEQTIALAAADGDWLHNVPLKQVRPFVEELTETARRELDVLVAELATGDVLDDNWVAPLAELANHIRPRYVE